MENGREAEGPSSPGNKAASLEVTWWGGAVSLNLLSPTCWLHSVKNYRELFQMGFGAGRRHHTSSQEQ